MLLRLISYLSYSSASVEWDIIDLFSGKARVSKWGRRAGLRCASYDIAYNDPKSTKRSKHNNQKRRSSMDINGEAGFAQLVLISQDC